MYGRCCGRPKVIGGPEACTTGRLWRFDRWGSANGIACTVSSISGDAAGGAECLQLAGAGLEEASRATFIEGG